MLQRGAKGNALLIVLITMGLVMALTLPLYYQNQTSQLLQQNAEDRLRQELAARDAIEESLKGKKVSGVELDLGETNPGVAIHGSDREKLEVTAVGLARGKTIAQRGSFQSLLEEGFPYAVFAPEGSVTLESLNSWTNPIAGTKDPLEIYSGRSVKVAAEEQIAIVDSLAFAEFHTLSSSTEIIAKGHFASFDDSSYENEGDILEARLETLYQKLSASTTNRTSLFVGKLTLGRITKLITKGDHQGLQFLSLQQALDWPFFTFPTVKSKGKTLDIELHTPLLPDGVNFRSGVDVGLPTMSADRMARIDHLNNQIRFFEWVLRHDMREKPPPLPGDSFMDHLNIDPSGRPSPYASMRWATVFPNTPMPISDGTQDGEDSSVDYSPEVDPDEEMEETPAEGEDGDEVDFDLGDEEEGETEEDFEESGDSSIREGGWYKILEAMDDVIRPYEDILDELRALTKRYNRGEIPEEEYRALRLELINKGESMLPQVEKARKFMATWQFPDLTIWGKIKGFAQVVNHLNRKISSLNEMLDNELRALTDNVTAGSGFVEGPDRAVEREFIGKRKLDPVKGYKGASYRRVMSLVWSEFRSLLKDTLKSFPMKTIKIKLLFKTIKIKIPAFWKIPSWLKDIGKNLVDRLRKLVERSACLIHLGAGPMAKFRDSEHIQLASFTVPRGRSHRIGTNSGGSEVDVVIVGDLWIQRGACFEVEGNLALQKPNNNNADPGTLGAEISNLLKPAGRIILEEGASLLVGGNLDAEQIVACAPPGKVHSITSAVLVKGDAVIKHGTRSGLVLDELARGAGAKRAGDALEIFFQDIAPNLSKLSLPKPVKKDRLMLSGPFYPRAAYFSQYPIIIKVILPAGPFYPTFENKGQNANNLIFRAFAVFYGVHLNLCLGENFTPHSDWWPFGRSRIPVFPKVVPLSALEKSKTLFSDMKSALGKLTELSFRDKIKDLAGNLKSNILGNFFSSTLPNVVVDIAKAAFDPSRSVPTSLSALDLGAITGPDVSVDDMSSLGSKLFELIGGSSTETKWAKYLLPECCGVLVYAKGKLLIGNDEDSDLASGFFVAGGDLELKTHTTVGAAMSLNGNVEANRFLHYAPFASASIYQPVELSGGTANPAGVATLWSQAVSRVKYGSRASAGEAFRFPKTPHYKSIWEGWLK